MNIKLLTELHLEFLSLKGGCTGLSESTLVKMPHCLKSHVMAHFYIQNVYLDLGCRDLNAVFSGHRLTYRLKLNSCVKTKTKSENLTKLKHDILVLFTG